MDNLPVISSHYEKLVDELRTSKDPDRVYRINPILVQSTADMTSALLPLPYGKVNTQRKTEIEKKIVTPLLPGARVI